MTNPTEQAATTEPTEEQVHAAEDLAHGIEKDLGLPEGSIKPDPTAFDPSGKKPDEAIPLEGMEMTAEEQQQAMRGMVSGLPSLSPKQASDLVAAGTFDHSLANTTTAIPDGAAVSQQVETQTYASNAVSQSDLQAWLADRIPKAFADSEAPANDLAGQLLAHFSVMKK